MVKPVFRKQFWAKTWKKISAKAWVSISAKKSQTKRSRRPAYAAEMPIEGVNESTNTPTADRERSSSPPNRPPQQPQPAPEQTGKPWRWSLIWLAALGVLGGMGTAALIWLVSLPPQIDCRDPARLTLDMERLYCAQEAAQSGDLSKLIDSMTKLGQWKPDHPLYKEAQRLIGEWSEQVFRHAIRKVEQGDLKGAEAAISHIPQTAPIHADAQKALTRWRKYSREAADIYAKAQTALKKRDWSGVSQQIVQLAEFERDHWQLEKGADFLARQLGTEKQAWQVLSRAQKLAASGTPQQIGAAIPLAQQVPAKTYAAEAAKVNLKQWSQKLVALGTQKWQKGDRAGAVATLKLAPNVVNTPEIEDLYKFSHAYKLANSALSQDWTPKVGHLLNLTEAIAALAQVKPASPFYSQAQAHKKDWQAQMKDLIQLKYASATAGLGQQSTLKLAIGQAKQIDADQPRRLQAQSLIAYWEQEAQRLEDRPILDQAIQFAKAGSISDLKAAIAQAGEIALGRALRVKAQTYIAMWRSQIQTLEDQPKLDRAWELARQGKLGEAIAAASGIQAGRSLYRQAQSAISDWRYQQVVDAQIARDQPILDRAASLAETGNLAAAIDVASQIEPGRALYGRAQSSIDQWQDQLNPPPISEPTIPSSDGFDPLEAIPTEAPWLQEPTPPAPQGATSFPTPTLQTSPTNPLPTNSPAPPATYEPYLQPNPTTPADGSTDGPTNGTTDGTTDGAPTPMGGPASPPIEQVPPPPVEPLPPEPLDVLPPAP
ncbi:hypothetical protein HJG54_19785 [Leptolyngbya sp. NK1-12]|uniref:Chromosome segregation ATPase n=1 Tax=Leptolyngbya sp. NK1-12 TaxID=2547451 RepID=A0AA97AHT2_9CYAN|nr:hypothetical protein [Leptolyngbya sp. NK1-12]WNZ24869.1 hypothetical protein HJG54_19785 [Leptolyngbya sp. NK1-12]